MTTDRNRRETDKPFRDYTVPPKIETPMIIECLKTGASSSNIWTNKQ